MKNLVLPKLIKATLIYSGFFMSVCFHVFAVAESADREKPIELEADTVTVNDAKKISTYAGNVILTQGTLIIKADKLIVREDKEGFQHSTSTGNPTTFKQKREGVNEYMEGSAQRIEYDGRMDKVQLYIRAWVKRGEDVVHGDYISYDANAEYAEVIGGTKTENGVSSSGRVKAIIQPKNKPAQPKTSPQSESPQPVPLSTNGAAPAVTKTLRFSNKLNTTNSPEAQVKE